MLSQLVSKQQKGILELSDMGTYLMKGNAKKRYALAAAYKSKLKALVFAKMTQRSNVVAQKQNRQIHQESP